MAYIIRKLSKVIVRENNQNVVIIFSALETTIDYERRAPSVDLADRSRVLPPWVQNV